MVKHAPFLQNLTNFSLISCSRVTATGVHAILASTHGRPHSFLELRTPGLHHLALEYLPQVRLDALPIDVLCPNLQNLSISHEPPTLAMPNPTTKLIPVIASHAETLRTLHLLSSSPVTHTTHLPAPPVSLPKLELLSLASQLHPQWLFMPPSPILVPNIRHLFLPLQRRHLSLLLDKLPDWPLLRSLHVVHPHVSIKDPWEVEFDTLLHIARTGVGLQEVGFRSHVWEVVERDGNRVRLEKFDTDGRVADVFALGRFLG